MYDFFWSNFRGSKILSEQLSDTLHILQCQVLRQDCCIRKRNSLRLRDREWVANGEMGPKLALEKAWSSLTCKRLLSLITKTNLKSSKVTNTPMQKAENAEAAA